MWLLNRSAEPDTYICEEEIQSVTGNRLQQVNDITHALSELTARLSHRLGKLDAPLLGRFDELGGPASPLSQSSRPPSPRRPDEMINGSAAVGIVGADGALWPTGPQPGLQQNTATFSTVEDIAAAGLTPLADATVGAPIAQGQSVASFVTASGSPPGSLAADRQIVPAPSALKPLTSPTGAAALAAAATVEADGSASAPTQAPQAGGGANSGGNTSGLFGRVFNPCIGVVKAGTSRLL